MARARTQAKALNPSSKFYLEDIALVSESCKRHMEVSEAPSGSLEIESTISTHVTTRGKKKGIATNLTITVVGRPSQAKGKKKKPDKSFEVEMTMEAFFQLKAGVNTPKDLSQREIYHMAIQLHPILMIRVRGVIAQMGYPAMPVPLGLDIDHFQAVDVKLQEAR